MDGHIFNQQMDFRSSQFIEEIMNEERVITLKGEDKVLDFLEKLFENRTELKFCQNQDQQDSQSLTLIKNVNHHTLDFAIRPTNKYDILNFDPEKPIFIFNESTSIRFTSTIRGKCRENLAFIKIPEELVIKYTRQGKRFCFEEYNLNVIYNNFSRHSYSRQHHVTEGALCDVSGHGISFKVPQAEIPNFNLGDKIIFSSINGYSLSQKISGRIVYMQIFNKDETGLYLKLGVSFERRIPIEQLLKYLENQYFIASNKDVA